MAKRNHIHNMVHFLTASRRQYQKKIMVISAHFNPKVLTPWRYKISNEPHLCRRSLTRGDALDFQQTKCLHIFVENNSDISSNTLRARAIALHFPYKSIKLVATNTSHQPHASPPTMYFPTSRNVLTRDGYVYPSRTPSSLFFRTETVSRKTTVVYPLTTTLVIDQILLLKSLIPVVYTKFTLVH